MAAATPIASELETRALTWPEQARALAITNDEDFARAGEMLRGIKQLDGEITSVFGPLKRKAQDAHRAIVAEEKKARDPLIEAESILKRSIGTYHAEQERKRREEQMRLEREAREREEAARLEEAAALEAAGATQEAERVLDEPAPVLMVAPPPAPPRVEGVAVRETFKARVVDLRKLVEAVAAGRQPLNLLIANESALNGMARALKGSFAVDGCEVVRESNVAARAR